MGVPATWSLSHVIAFASAGYQVRAKANPSNVGISLALCTGCCGDALTHAWWSLIRAIDPSKRKTEHASANTMKLTDQASRIKPARRLYNCCTASAPPMAKKSHACNENLNTVFMRK